MWKNRSSFTLMICLIRTCFLRSGSDISGSSATSAENPDGNETKRLSVGSCDGSDSGDQLYQFSLTPLTCATCGEPIERAGDDGVPLADGTWRHHQCHYGRTWRTRICCGTNFLHPAMSQSPYDPTMANIPFTSAFPTIIFINREGIEETVLRIESFMSIKKS